MIELKWGDRKQLPDRRAATVMVIKHSFDTGSNEQKYYVTAGFHPDGTVGECFINTSKISSPQEAYAKDAAIAVSIALQYGAPVEVLRNAMSRGYRDQHPGSPIGAICDLLAGLGPFGEPPPEEPESADRGQGGGAR